MFIENKDFYPTPQTLIDRMMEGLEWKMIYTVLEPSSGKGNIVEAYYVFHRKIGGIICIVWY